MHTFQLIIFLHPIRPRFAFLSYWRHWHASHTWRQNVTHSVAAGKLVAMATASNAVILKYQLILEQAILVRYKMHGPTKMLIIKPKDKRLFGRTRCKCKVTYDCQCSLLIQQYTTTAYGGVDLQIQVFLTSARVGGEWPDSRAGLLYSLGKNSRY
jgi:hypothetical protein